MRQELVGIDDHLVLPDESTDGGNLRDAGYRGQLVAQVPVLEASEFGEIELRQGELRGPVEGAGPRGVEDAHPPEVATAPLGRVFRRGVPPILRVVPPDPLRVIRAVVAVDEAVLVHPPDAGGVRPEAGGHALGQPPPGEVQVLEDAGTGPVQVGPVLEDDVDEGETEEGVTADDLRVRNGEHRRGQWIGDLVLHDLGSLSGIVRIDNDLYVGEVGDRVQLDGLDRVDARGEEEEREEEDQELVADAEGDQAADHARWSPGVLVRGTGCRPVGRVP